ncbi:MAG: alpha/beta hydrolase [Bacteroidota bacterium]
MKIIFNALKWISLSLGLLIALVLLAGFTVKCFAPSAHPPGELVDVGGFKLHVHATGERNEKPTLVLEAGAGAPGEYYHWISEGLKDSLRVVRYDRAGIGYSELANTPRHPETVARELHQLLELSGESPPYLMAGHSYGGHYIRIFTEMYPDEVAGMVFSDATHPESSQRTNLPEEPWFVQPLYHIAAVLGDVGVLHLVDQMVGPILWAPGLPEEQLQRMKDYTKSGKYLRGYLEGDDRWGSELGTLAAQTDNFGDLPIQVFSGTNLNEALLIKMGLDPNHIRTQRANMQQELADLSTEGEVFFMDGGHVTIFTLPEQADFICRHILRRWSPDKEASDLTQ